MLSNRHPALLQGGLALATLLIAVASLCAGQYHLSLSEVFSQLGHLSPADGVAGQIVWSVRLPRVIMALLAGGALGLCGATLQGVFQNPLGGSPYHWRHLRFRVWRHAGYPAGGWTPC
ncbi:Probable ABC transporter permease protein HI_1471 [Raoultella planticola]|uniref:Probable ABC transporter permease protein HI_1471 n=1 Tax=Raoultella planticola TaxID=575 RepID=A0A485AGA5_RAOPL|nr:Probable ABC transporter permease protein HI_1471 [Raoultella planticola]